MYYFTGDRPGNPAASSPNRKAEKKIQIPGLSIFRENVHWFPEEEERGDKSQRKRVSGDEKKREGGRKRKDKKRRSGTPETSIVPYTGVNSSNGTVNAGYSTSEQNLSDDLEDWETVSIDSVTL